MIPVSSNRVVLVRRYYICTIEFYSLGKLLYKNLSPSFEPSPQRGEGVSSSPLRGED